MLHGIVGPVVLALVAAAGAGAPSSYAPHSVSGAHPAAAQTLPTPSPAAPAATDRCGAEPRDAAGWTRLFRGLDGDWAGGDAALSVRLPDDRLLWLFGDTFVGDVLDDGSRAPGTRIVRNSAVLTRGTCAVSVTPGRATLPGRGSTWLWPTSAAVTTTSASGSATVAVFTQRMRRTGDGAWGFGRVGAAVVTMTVRRDGAATVAGVRDLPESDVLWGAATVVQGATTYIYGTRTVDEPLVFGRELLIARAPTATVRDQGTWAYRTATGWSARSSDAAVVLPARTGVSTTPTVVVRGGSFRIVTKPQEFLDDRVVELTSRSPFGPWTSRTLFRSASSGSRPTYAPTVVATDGRGLDIVVVSRTSTSAAALMDDATLTIPVFRDVDLGR